jgi:predicted transcriptional regulator
MMGVLLLARRYEDRNGPATRQEIVNLLSRQPGLNKSQLCRALGLAWGTVAHHVRLLEAEKRIVRQDLGGRKHLFVPGTQPQELALMVLLRQEPANRILDLLQDHPGLGIQDLSRSMSLSRKIVRRFLFSLERMGLVQRAVAYRPTFYRVCPDSKGPGSPPHELRPDSKPDEEFSHP